MTHLVLKETVLQCFISWVAASALKQQLVFLRTQKPNFRPRSRFPNFFQQNRVGKFKMGFSFVVMQATTVWTYRVEISDSLDLLVVICTGQLCEAFWVQLAAVGEELSTVLFGQLCAERVDGDDEGSPVSFKLQQRQEG